MEDGHANLLYFHDNSPPPFVTMHTNFEGQENWPVSSLGYTDPFKVQEVEDDEEACIMTAEEALL